MKALAYLVGLLLSAPVLAFALGVLALGHAIATRNVFTLLYQLVQVLAWGLPLAALAALALVALVACAFFRRGRLAGAGMLVALNVAALVVVLRATGLPREGGEALLFLPTVVAIGLHGTLLLQRVPRSRAA